MAEKSPGEQASADSGPLFQKPPETPEEIERNKPLAISPDEVLEMEEADWYEKVYRGDSASQLTVRALGMGALLGFFLAFTNVYIGLKTGWHLGVAITACILSFALWESLVQAKVVRSRMTILENNCMQSTASAAGYSTGGTMVSAIPALLLLSVTAENPGGTQLSWPVLAAWTLFLAALGVCLAIPMKRNMINQEKLRFPSGTAAAVTLQSLYSQGTEAVVKARALLYAAILGGIMPLLKDLNFIKKMEDGKVVRVALIPGASKIFDWLPTISAGGQAYKLSAWNIKLDHGLALVAAGAIVGLRVTVSMVASGLFLAYYIGPKAMSAEWTNTLGKVVTAATKPAAAWKEIGLWVGAPILVASGLLSFAFQWRTIGRAFSGLFAKKQGSEHDARVARVEVPTSWFLWGAGISGAGVIIIAQMFFEIPWYLGIVAVVLTFVLALVACRSTGESDITPTGAMGKIMQLIYGILIPQSATANLMTAGVTAGASSASADLLNDLKAGYLLGANPRRQFVAQILGVLPGTVATVICYYILVPDASALVGQGGADPPFPAPAAQQWKAVAEVFRLGIGNLHPMARECIAYGLVAGAALVLLEKALPKYKKWLPSPIGIGLGLILPFYYPLAMFLGAAAAALVKGTMSKKSAELIVPVSSGIIAGESIIGVIVAALNNFVLK